MKKILLTLLVLFTVFGTVMAAHWKKPSPYDYPDETVLYLSLEDNPLIEVAAFIDGECREVQTEAFRDPFVGSEGIIYRLRVRGDMKVDANKTITLKVFDEFSSLVYLPKPTFVFDGETHGSYTEGIKVDILTVRGLYVEDRIYVTEGGTVDLSDYVKLFYNDGIAENDVSPIDLDETPVRFRYEVHGQYYEQDENEYWVQRDYFTVDEEKNTLTGLHDTSEADEGYPYLMVMTENGLLSGTAVVTVARKDIPIETLTCDANDITIYIFEDARTFIEPHLHFTPEETSNKLYTIEELLEEGQTGLLGVGYSCVGPGDTKVRMVSRSNKEVKTDPVTLHAKSRPTEIRLLKDTLYVGEGTDLLAELEKIIELSTMSYPEYMDRDLTIECLGVRVFDENYIVNRSSGQCNLRIRATAMEPESHWEGDDLVYGYAWVEVVVVVRIPVTGIEASETTIYVQRGDDVYEKLRKVVTIQPDNASNKELVITPKNNNGYIDDKGIAQKEGQLTVNVASGENGNYNVDITVIIMGDLFFTLNDVTVSKFGTADVVIDWTTAIDPLRLQLVPQDHDNFGWGPVATVERLDDSGRKWRFRGRYFGSFEYGVTYDGSVGKKDANTVARAKITIPVEYEYEAGWNWLSMPVVTKAKQQLAISASATPDFTEVRSFEAQTLLDPELGYFGTLETITANEAYKVKAAKAGIISLGSGELLKAESQVNVQPGYNWLVYPHEINHSMESLGSRIKMFSQKNDMIVGRDMFAIYDGETWVAPETFQLETGHGYLYYNAVEVERPITWGSLDMEPEPEPDGARRAESRAAEWRPVRAAFADNMTIIAQLDGVAQLDRYSVGAFVGDECRGSSQLAGGLYLFITVAGKPGERIRFCLYDRQTDSYSTLDRQLTFSARAGSLQQPLLFMPDFTGIDSPVQNAAIAYSDGTVSISGLGSHPTVTLCDASGRTVAQTKGTSLSLSHQPAGIYVVRATDGGRMLSRKILK